MEYDKNKIYKRTKNGNIKIGRQVLYIKTCKYCGCEFLGRINSTNCSRTCLNKAKGCNEETREKLKQINLGKKLSEEHKKNIRESMKKCHLWKGGITKLNIPLYDTYVHQLEPIEQCRRTEEGYLEVKCAYCGRWYISKTTTIKKRIYCINGGTSGEHRLYCSKECKSNCPIYNQIKYPKGYKPATSREVQPELRQMVFERDGWTCIKCGATNNLHCHHIEGLNQNPIESCDMDICITLCKKCHKYVHTLPGCSYYDMRCKR